MKLLKVAFLWSSFFLMSLSVWASEGVLDTTFHSPDGYVLWDGGSGYDRGRDIALQQDGKIVVTGYMTNGTDNDLMVIRYNRDGTLDASFGTNGAYIYDGGNGNDGAYAIAVQSDNKILLAGDSLNGTDDDVIVLRLDSDGTLDPNFGSNGIFTFDSGNEAAIDLLIQSDGKIVICGSSSNGTNNDLLVIRLNADGALDMTFGTNGVALYDGGNGYDTGLRLTVQQDGAILVTGSSYNGSDHDILVARFNTNGTLDTTFGTGGIVIYDGGDYDRGYGIDTNSNGNILVTGLLTKPDPNSTDYDIPVICFDSNGTLDTSFGNNGIVLYDGGTREECYDLIVQNDDTILIAGHSGGSTGAISDWGLVVLKYTQNGTLDTTFGTNGVYQYDPTENTEWGYGLALQTDGRIVVTGQAHNGTDDDVIVLRLTNSAGDSNESNEPNSPSDPNNHLPVIFADPNLEIAVEIALGVTDPTPSDMLSLYRLDAMSLGIADITGLEYATNLQILDLRFNQISDISELSRLTNLWWLGIYSNLISDLSPLSGLTNLQELDPGNNQISDISAISNLTNLTYLDLTQNQISNTNALSGLTNLTRLYLSNNHITNISPLHGLTNLTSLDIGWNQVTDINDLSALTALEGLWLSDNQITNVSILTGFTNLTTLWLQQNPLNDNAYCTDLATIAANNPLLTDLQYTPNASVPTGISASDGTYSDKVSITWNQHCNGPKYTSFYKVYRADSATSAKPTISSWQTTTSFDDISATAGMTYTYWVQAATSDQGEYATDYSVSDTGYISNGQPPQQTCTITGKKWNDVNGDGSSSGEQGLSGWTIFAEPAALANGQLDAGESSAATNQQGNFTISGLSSGTYRVYEVLQNGWIQKFPTQGFHEVTCTGNQTVTNVDFGNQQTGSAQEYDWGDAPDPAYPTLQTNNGAYHVIVPGFFLGGSVDADADGRPQPDALGDDHDGNDDEDGVIFLTPLMPGQQAAVEVITPAAGHLDAWIDFDADGSWTQVSDQIFQSKAIPIGSNLLTFQVPAEIAINIDTYARFRFSSAGALTPDGPAQDGEVEDYHLLLGEGGPMVPGEGPVPHVTWSQPPIEINPSMDMPPVFCGWGEPARSTEQSGQRRQWRMDADDFRCLGAIPVTRLRWWGGYKGWTSPEPPESQPYAWHIGIWANQVEGVTQDESFPERLVWSLEIPPERIRLEPVGLNEFPQQPLSMCFVYEVQLEPEEWFHQAAYESNDDVFWISITAIYPADAEAKNMWGWITRPHIWGNGAVMPAIMGDWPTDDERLFPGRIYPIENSLMCGQNQPYDMCFELLTDQPWAKWDQPFTGSRDWPEYTNHMSMAFKPEGGELSVLRQVADDWVSGNLEPVNAMAWNGSYIGYSYQACTCEERIEPRRPDYFLLSIWTNTPPDDMGQNNHPGDKVWEYTAYDYDEVMVGYDGNSDDGLSEAVFRYSVRLPDNASYRPQLPESVYWFGVMAVFEEPVGDIPYQWGWTNHPHMFGTPASTIDNSSASPSKWRECLNMDGGPVDMSFIFFTAPEHEP